MQMPRVTCLSRTTLILNITAAARLGLEFCKGQLRSWSRFKRYSARSERTRNRCTRTHPFAHRILSRSERSPRRWQSGGTRNQSLPQPYEHSVGRTFRALGVKQLSLPGQSSRSLRAVRPNPSLERTSTGLAREPMQGIIPSRGPIRQRTAQLKR